VLALLLAASFVGGLAFQTLESATSAPKKMDKKSGDEGKWQRHEDADDDDSDATFQKHHDD